MQLAFLDTETLGLDHVNHPIYEVGLIVRDDVDTEHRWTFNPGRRLADADPTALRLNGYYARSEDLPVGITHARYWIDGVEQDTPAVEQALWEIAYLTAGRHIVGAVPSFDTERLETMLREYGRCPAWHYHVIDVEAMAIGWVAGRRRQLDRIMTERGWDSYVLSNVVGAPRYTDAHTALADARWARDMYDAIVHGKSVYVSTRKAQ